MKNVLVISFESFKSKQLGIKSPAFYKHQGNQSSPIAYLKKSKFCSDEEFEILKNHIEYLLEPKYGK